MKEKFSFSNKFTKKEFVEMLSESYVDLKKKKQISEDQSVLLEQEYNETLEATMKLVENSIVRNTKQLRRSIKENLKQIATENYKRLNTTKQSLYEDLYSEFLSKTPQFNNIISENIYELN